MIQSRKGTTRFNSNFLVISVIVVGLVFGTLLINSMFSDVESPIILKNCKNANPYHEGAFFECVRAKMGSESKAKEMIAQFYSNPSNVYLSPNQTEDKVGCYDYDGGINYFVRGDVTQILSNSTRINIMDSCSGKELLEAYCQDDYLASTYSYTCERECKDGMCVN